MKYILLITLLLGYIQKIGYIEQSFAAAGDKPFIISREEWGAENDYNSRESTYWQNILEQRSQAATKTPDPVAAKKAQEKNEKINDYLNGNFLDQFTSQETVYYNNSKGNSYAWPIKYTSYVDSIIVHHTEGEYSDSLTGIQNIHKFHSISRQWGDIGYNYIIGYDGEIFEGRDGGDYSVGAHSKYNNFGTIGISLLGNYNNRDVTNSQKESLESLIQYLTKKYGIDLNNKRYYHMNCSGSKCNTFPIETYLDSVLSGHRDTGHTSCPGENLYPIIEEIRLNNLDFTAGFTPILRGQEATENREEPEYQSSQIFIYKNIISDYDDIKLKKLKNTIEQAINSGKYDQELTKKLQILRIAVVLSMKG